MKNIYSLFLTMLFCIVGMTANAADIKLTIDVDDASRVGIKITDANYVYQEQTVVTGTNEYTVPACSTVKVYAKEGALITNIKNTLASNDICNGYYDTYEVYTFDSNMSISIKSAKEDDVFTGSFKINVDNPNAVSASLSGTNRNIALQKGANTVKYAPEKETEVYINSSSGTPLYKVMNNGAEIKNAGGYAIPTKDANIEVISVWPDDVKFNMSFSYNNEDAKNAISAVSVNYEPISDFTNGFEVKGGASVSITFNTSEYNIESFKANGQNVSIYGSYYFYATENVKFEVNAKKFGNIKVNVSVDEPSNVIVYDGYAYQGKTIELKKGENTVEVVENGNNCITVEANSGCYLTSVTHNGEEKYSYGSDVSVYDIKEGSTIVIKSGKINRDQVANVFVWGRDLASEYFNFCNRDGSLVPELVEGKNTVNFYEKDFPFGFNCYGESIGSENKIYINNVKAQGYYGSYALYFENEARIDIVLNDHFKDSEKNVQFIFNDGIDQSMVSSVMLPSNNQAWNWATEGLTAIENASYDVTIKPTSTANIAAVTDNGNIYKVNAEGVIVIKVTPETKSITLADATSVGINEINNDASADKKIYTLEGIEVKNAKRGLYIVGGKIRVF